MGRGSITRTGALVNRLSLAMAGRCQRMLSKIRCFSWLRTDIVVSRTTGVVMDARAQPWTGNDLDTYADDLAELTEALDLKDAIHVGHSTGGGEVARYIGRHGSSRVSKAVLIGAITPVMVKTRNQSRWFADSGVRRDSCERVGRSFEVLEGPFHSVLRIQSTRRESFGRPARILLAAGMMCGLPGAYFCIKAFSETDLTEDLKKIDVPDFDPAWR